MSRVNKFQSEIRDALETISSELIVVMKIHPITRLRIEQAQKRSGLDELLGPAVKEMDEENKSIAEIWKQVAFLLDRMSQ